MLVTACQTNQPSPTPGLPSGSASHTHHQPCMEPPGPTSPQQMGTVTSKLPSRAWLTVVVAQGAVGDLVPLRRLVRRCRLGVRREDWHWTEEHTALGCSRPWECGSLSRSPIPLLEVKPIFLHLRRRRNLPPAVCGLVEGDTWARSGKRVQPNVNLLPWVCRVLRQAPLAPMSIPQDTHDLRRSPLFSLLPTAVQSEELCRGHEMENHVRAATRAHAPLGGAITPCPAPNSHVGSSRCNRLLSLGSHQQPLEGWPTGQHKDWDIWWGYGVAQTLKWLSWG